FDKNLSITDVNIHLIYKNGIISIKKFHFNLYNTYLSLIGKMNFSTNNAFLKVNISRLTVRNLCAYILNDMVNNKFRKWYCRNIDGDIVNTVVSFNGKFNNLINDN
ncbi:MAG: AsmA family protein, partial [Wolbachia pipientis]|nr:AsmA family protein [Wolbachia pipientis]